MYIYTYNIIYPCYRSTSHLQSSTDSKWSVLPGIDAPVGGRGGAWRMVLWAIARDGMYYVFILYIYNLVDHLCIYIHNIWAPVKVLYISVVATIGCRFFGGHITLQCLVSLSLLGVAYRLTVFRAHLWQTPAILKWSSNILIMAHIHVCYIYYIHCIYCIYSVSMYK